MVLLIKLFGIVIVVLGIIFMLKEDALRSYIAFWKNEKRLKLGGIIAFLFGIVFLMAAPECRITWLVIVLGIWSMIKGVLLFAISPKKLFDYFDWWGKKSFSSIRYLGIVAIAFGVLLIYCAS